MMKIIIGFLVLILISTPVSAKHPAKAAGDTPDETGNDNPWYVGVGLGADAPISGWDTDYLLGGGGTFLVGCKLDRSFSIQLDGEYWSFAGGNTSAFDARFFPLLRLNLEGQGFHPYLLAGPGYDLHSDTPIGYSTSSLAAALGAGLECDLAKKDHLFLEARYDLLFYSDVTLQDIPITAGLRVDL
jgi:hypothetical protein